MLSHPAVPHPADADPDQRAVHAAEHAVETWVDSATPQAPTVEVAGRVFTPQPDPKFEGPEAVGRYLDQVLAHLVSQGCDYGGQQHRAVTVRARRGAHRAHYEFDSCTIAVPPREIGGRWALRGLVALHELAHHLAGQPGHGPWWRTTFLRLLEDVGHGDLAELMHLAFAAEGLTALPHDTSESTVARIAKLLRQGEASTNPHERDAFISRAQQLASTASVALAVARAHGRGTEAREEPTTQQVVIGTRGQRGLARFVRLLVNIAAANDVRCTILHGSVAVTLHGFPSDLAATHALYESLMVQMVADFERYRDEVPAAPEWIWNATLGDYEFKAPATLSRRLAFYEAYANRIGQRLAEARSAAVAEAARRDRAGAAGAAGVPSTTTEVALRQKEIEVHDFFAARLRAEGITSTWRGDRASAAERAPSAGAAGITAASRATLGSERALG